VLQPDPTGESPVTTAGRSLATALSKARFASGTRTKTYTTIRGTTFVPDGGKLARKGIGTIALDST
jgi:hypothetical protein